MKIFPWRSTSLRQRFTMGVVARLLPLIVLTVGSLFSVETMISSFENTENRTLEEIFPLDRLQSLLFEVSEPIEDYLHSGNRRERDRFTALSQEIDLTFTKLLSISSDLPERKSLIQAAEKSWRELRKTGVEIFASPYPLPSQKAIAEDRRLSKHSRETVENVNRFYKVLYHVQREQNLEQVSQLRERVRSIVIIMLGLELLIATIAGFIFVRSILVPLDSLEKGVRHLSDGDLDYRVNLMTSDELGQLATTLNQMAAKLLQTQTELHDLATKDGLTGLYNRREFNKQLKAEIERSQRYHHNCSLLILDIDFFKKLNDTYGHQGGDEALRTVGALLRQEVRPIDRAARYGGEEFVIILPETDGESAAVVGERLRTAIRSHLIPVSPTQSINITISLGCATFPINADSEDALISAADQALYIAKRSGRDRVISFSSLSLLT
jgi:two-component system, cell cycle response regulator